MRRITRREWFKGAAAMTAGTAVACGAKTGLPVPDIIYSWVLDVDATSATVVGWNELGVPMTASLYLNLDGDSVQTLQLDGPSAQSARFTGLVEGTKYYAVVTTDDGYEGETLKWNEFVTAPNDTRTVRIAVSGDARPSFDLTIFGHLADQQVDFYVSLGDFPYVDIGDAIDPVAIRQTYIDLLTADGLQDFLRSTSIRPIYDDHEVENNWNALTPPAKVAAGIEAWNEFFPIPGNTTVRKWGWGPHVDCFMLDCRKFRDAVSMIGPDQREFLVAAITSSQKPFKLIFTSVPLDFAKGFDSWTGFAEERESILAELAKNGASGVLFLSADQHWFGANLHSHNVHEFQCGPLAADIFDPPANSPAVTRMAANYGLIEIDATELRFTPIGADGQPLGVHDDDPNLPDTFVFTIADLTLT